jgi:hypothetical protein
MELFSEIYSTYYNAVERLLREASNKPLAVRDIQRILADNAFSESAYHVLPKLQSGDWPLLKETADGYAAACSPLTEKPLTTLQLSWLKAILDDARIRLFFEDTELKELHDVLKDVPPLFRLEDFYTFDQARDGDGYESEQYRRSFRIFLNAINRKTAVAVIYEGGKGSRVNSVFWPYKLEYSSKDDKFRAQCYRRHGQRKVHCILNLGRVVSVHAALVHDSVTAAMQEVTPAARFCEMTLEITKERNALERCMIQFAHFEKRTEYDAKADRYTCTIKYNVMDESELVIRVLSFGPTVRVLGPEKFLNEIRQRVEKQNQLISQNQGRYRDAEAIISNKTLQP